MSEFKKPFNAEETKMGKSKVVDAIGFSVATINSYHDKDIAVLFAAAPELLNALESTQSLLERLGFQSSDEYQANAYAIAKAKGDGNDL